MRTASLILLALIVATVAGLYSVAELGQEVVVLHRWSPEAEPDRTRLWIVDQGEQSWIHHGDTEAPWVRRLAGNPAVVLERSGATREYRASPDPEADARVHQLMGEKYGFFARALATSPEDCSVLPVRLDPMED